MNRASFDMSQDFLRQMLRLPESARIVGASYNEESGFVTFVADDPNLPEGERKVSPQIRKVESLVWDWNVGEEQEEQEEQEPTELPPPPPPSPDPHAGHNHG